MTAHAVVRQVVPADAATAFDLVLVGRPPPFEDRAASTRCRAQVLAGVIEPVAPAAFRLETRRRLRALAEYLAAA